MIGKGERELSYESHRPKIAIKRCVLGNGTRILKEPLAKEERKGVSEEGKLKVVHWRKRSFTRLGNTKSV